MSVNIRVGTLQLTNANGTTPVTVTLPAGFDLKAVQFFMHASIGVARFVSMGAATGTATGSQGVLGWETQRKTSGTTQALTMIANTAVLSYWDGATRLAAVTTFASESFAITPPATPSQTISVSWIAFGGSSVLADFRVLQLQTSATTTPVSVAGFSSETPTYIALASRNGTTALGTAANEVTGSFGVSTGTTEHTIAAYEARLADPSQTATNYRRDAISRPLTNRTTERQTVTVTHDVGGYTLSQSSTFNDRVWVLSLCGVEAAILSGAIPSATGTQALTGAGVAPDAIIGFGAPLVTTVGSAVTNSVMLGMAGRNGGTTAEAATSLYSQDNSAPTFPVDAQFNSASFFRKLTDTTVDAEADVDSWDADGVTLNWTNADAVAGLFTVVALGGAAAGPGFRSYYLNA